MTHAIRIHKSGGADQLSWDEISVADPGPGEVRIRQTAVGLNFLDVYMRSGLYPLAKFPATSFPTPPRPRSISRGSRPFGVGTISYPPF